MAELAAAYWNMRDMRRRALRNESTALMMHTCVETRMASSGAKMNKLKEL